MSTTTTNLGLLRPELTDSADITAYNGNWDKIDETFGRIDLTKDTEKYVKFAQESLEARKLQNTLTVKMNGGKTENTDMWTFDGSVDKSINIKAAPVSHDHSSKGVSGVIKCCSVIGSGVILTKDNAAENNLTPGLWLITSNSVTSTDVWFPTHLSKNHITAGISKIPLPALLFVTEATDERKNVIDILGGQEATATLGDDGDTYIITTTHRPDYSYGTEDLVPGVSPLETGKLYFVYE